MTKYSNRKFSESYGGEKYAEGWERIFGKKVCTECGGPLKEGEGNVMGKEHWCQACVDYWLAEEAADES